MDKPNPPSTPPVLTYANPRDRPARRGSVALANVVAIAGMLLWLIGFPFAAGGMFALVAAIYERNLPTLGGAALVLTIGLGIWSLAFWACRSVYGIANGRQ